MRTQDHTNSLKKGMLPFHLALMICQCLQHPRFPPSPLPQTIFPTAMSLWTITPAVGRGVTVHICIPDGTTTLPSWADPRHCVSNACEPYPDLVITWQTQAETFADDYDVRAAGGWRDGLRMQHDPTRRMVLTSFLYLDLSCRMKQWGKAVTTYDRQSSGFHTISGRFRHITPFSTPNGDFSVWARHILCLWVRCALAKSVIATVTIVRYSVMSWTKGYANVYTQI